MFFYDIQVGSNHKQHNEKTCCKTESGLEKLRSGLMHYLRGLVGCSGVGSSEEAVANHGTEAQAPQTCI